MSNHPKKNELYTPWGPQIVELLDRMRAELGTWRDVSWKGGVRLKVLRGLRQGTHANQAKPRTTVSMTVLDRMIQGCGVGNLNDYPWYTPDELIGLGLWEPFEKEEEAR